MDAPDDTTTSLDATGTRILVAGATGGTGRWVLRALDGRPPTVRALTRSADGHDRLRRLGADEVVVGDLFDPDDARAAVEDVDAVLSAVGSAGRAVLTADEFVDGTGNRNLVEAAAEAGTEAFVTESALGVGDEPASPLATAFDLFIGPVQRAKAEAEAALRDAPLRHTILRPGVLTGGPRTGLVQTAKPGARLWGGVTRADVAHLLAAAPFTPAAADRTLEVVSNPLLKRRAEPIDWQLPREPR
jgi:uncharacterized protein YbjT (DUF2867 family)